MASSEWEQFSAGNYPVIQVTSVHLQSHFPLKEQKRVLTDLSFVALSRKWRL